ncbi:PREDICTED: spermatogenesis-associated protein 1 [Gekko japonicus]|uniref:Spermatogenesis-associated protein 1 n=1 Tax=Gekko japonicus TaxID=146911 RepID=A0ABM1KMD6_GEKJA|nr:PREDICTED: spermatogenesis-associated protein 1 [Gekko japonicus]
MIYKPPKLALLELHVFYVPEEVWNFKLNTVSVDATSKFSSAGFIRVSPHMTLRTLREQLREHLGEDAVVNKYTFLKCIGGKLAMVKAKQEMELKLRSFAPPYAFHPELYLLPGVESIYSSSSSTPEWPPSNAECVLAYHHKPLSSAAPKHGVDQNPAVLETSLKNNFSQMQKKDANTEDGDNNAKGRRTTGDSGIPESLEDRDQEYLHSKKSQQHPDITKSAADTGGMQDNQADENNIDNFTYPSQYLQPPTPPLLALCINRPQTPNRVFSTEGNELNRQLQPIKAERKHLEKTREELIKKVKGLLVQNKLRRYHARDIWKKKYFETKKVTASLEEDLNKLRENLELHYQKVLMKLQARHVQKRGNNLTKVMDKQNNAIIQITILQHDIEQLRRKLDNAKMKLAIAIKIRKQATSDSQALKAELAHKKVQSSLKLSSEKQMR